MCLGKVFPALWSLCVGRVGVGIVGFVFGRPRRVVLRLATKKYGGLSSLWFLLLYPLLLLLLLLLLFQHLQVLLWSTQVH